MNDDIPNELTPEERERFDALPREVPPPPALERRIVHGLRSRKLLRPGGIPWLPVARTGAALAAGFVAGLFVSGTGPGPAVPEPAAGPAVAPPTVPAMGAPTASNTYFLLLYEDDRYQYAAPDEWMERVAEYGAWADRAIDDGRFLGGEKLADSGLVLVATADGIKQRRGLTAPGELSGFFIIRAASDEDAAEYARDHPHLRYRGTVAIRAVDPVP